MFTIVKDTEKSLREKSTPVELPLSAHDKKTLLAMVDYLKKSQDPAYVEKHHIREGVGLAAPQIGQNKRMLAVHFKQGESIIEHALVNPKIIAHSVKMAYLSTGEGCLSVDTEHPGFVYRPNKITVKAFDAITNAPVEIIARGFEAIVLQHEIDHLDGILFYDRIDKNNPSFKDDSAIAV